MTEEPAAQALALRVRDDLEAAGWTVRLTMMEVGEPGYAVLAPGLGSLGLGLSATRSEAEGRAVIFVNAIRGIPEKDLDG